MPNTQSTDWNAGYARHRDYQWTTTHQLARILQMCNAPTHGKVLDIGCGTGQLCRDLFHRGYRVTGIDISDEAISLARNSTVYHDGITFEVADIERRDLSDREFDLIFCKYVLAFITQKAEFLQYARTLLAADGTIIIISPDAEALPPVKKHIALQHDATLAMLEKYFDHVRSEYIGGDYYYFCGCGVKS